MGNILKFPHFLLAKKIMEKVSQDLKYCKD